MSIKRVGFHVLILYASCIFALGCDDDGKAECGNRKIEGDEQCDKNLGGTTCRDLGHDRGLLACTNDCTYDESACIDCGNGLAEDGEVCDGTDLDGKTCEHLGHTGGDLSCTENCTFDESACHDSLPLTFQILEFSPDIETGIPLPGATVALDAPSGERFEQVARGDGKVTFENIDWTAGLTSVTVHLDGYVMASFLDFDATELKEEEPFYISKIVPDQPETVTVSGTITGITDIAHTCVVNVTNTAVGNEWQGTGDQTFTVIVPKGQSFVLQGMELVQEGVPSGQGYSMTFYRVMQQRFDAIGDNLADVVLDFAANEVQTYTEDSWFTLPARTDSPIRRGSPVCLVCAGNSLYCTGWASLVDISADGNQFDVSYLWNEPAWAEEVVSFCYVVNQLGLGVSQTMMQGYPQPGELGAFLDVPGWITPADPSVPHPMFDPLEWELLETTNYTRLIIQRNGRSIWFVNRRHGSTSIVPPALPSSVVSEDFLGTAPLPAYIQVGTLDEDMTYFEQLAQAQMILLTP